MARDSSQPSSATFWLTIGLTAVAIILPRETRADSFFGTIGIGIAVGTVLGASTLPFYDSPGEHVTNLAVGAGIGAGVGLVAAIYSGIAGTNREADSAARDTIQNRGYDPVLLARVQIPASRSFIQMPLVSYSW